MKTFSFPESSPLTVLGIETSCDETAAAVVRKDIHGKGLILSNVIRSQWDEHRAYGGIVPEIAARAHVSTLDEIVKLAMKQAKIEFSELSGIAVSAGPGLLGGLVVGMVTGKALALAHSKPFLALNHLEAHALTVGLTDGLRPPYLLLLVSGGHTQLLIVKGIGSYERLGTTIDDSLGEAFDKTAKLLGLEQPGGPSVERAALKGNPKRFHFPRPMIGHEEVHFSFAGLKTAVRRKASELAPLADQDIFDLSAGFQEAAFDAVMDRVERALLIAEKKIEYLNPRHLVVSGGVASNQALKERLKKLISQYNYELYIPPKELCTDNAAMVGWAGAEKLSLGIYDKLNAEAKARWPLDSTAPKARGAGVKA